MASTDSHESKDDVQVSTAATEQKESDGDQGKTASNFWRIMSYSTSIERYFLALAALCAAATGATLPVMFIVFGHLVTTFNGYFIPGSSVPEDHFRGQVNQLALYIVYIFIARFVLGYISTFAFRIVGLRISAAMRLAYLTALFNQSVGFVDRLSPGAATEVMTNVANTVQVAVGEKIGALIQGIALILSSYIVAFTYSWRLTLVASSMIAFIIIVSGVAVPMIYKYTTSGMESLTKASGVTSEVLYGIRTIKSLCAEGDAVERHTQHTMEAEKHGLKKTPWLTLQYWPVFFSPYANMALTFWAGARFYGQHQVSNVGDITIVLFTMMVALQGVGTAFTPIQNITKACAAAVSCFQVIDAPRPKRDGLRGSEVGKNLDISFKNVSFSYPSRPQVQILKDLSFNIQEGKVTAFVGPSGCGKSTLVALLERWYDLSEVNKPLPVEIAEDKIQPKKNKKSKSGLETTPEKSSAIDPGEIFQNCGTINIGLHSIEAIDARWLRAQIGLVQQEPVLFNATIFDNVVNGLNGSEWENSDYDTKLELVKSACEEAYANEFILRLPDQYNTKVGEGGIKLSGGQRQRLAIARSIIKKPAILILDEATSSIDVHGERLVTAALERASQGRTTLLIAHRLSTIRSADHIIVLKQGTIAEQGSHSELMAGDGVYATLVKAQNLAIGVTEVINDDEIPPHDLQDLEVRELEKTLTETKTTADDEISTTSYQKHGFVRSVGYLLYEQRHYYILYTFLLLGSIGAGSAYPMQAWFFSHLIVVFQYTGSKLISSANHWALLLFVLALCIGACYAIIGYCSNTLSVRVSTVYRDSYFSSVLYKPISWFDEEDHSVGTLTSQVGADPKELEEVTGPNMVFPLIAVFSMTGCIAISFAYGWKLTLVVFFAALPVILVSSFFRLRYEMRFEAMNAAVFATSSKFATESIRAFRTVTALTLEDKILKQYRGLLEKLTQDAFKKARFSILIFSASDSLEMLTMALGFWYGGQLLARREYNVLQFFVIYTAIVQGGQAAGQYLAFGPNVARATAAANRILSFRSGSEVLSGKSKRPDGDASGHGIEFRNVGFKYPTRDAPVYRDLSFTIHAGQYTAFVGPSGCGKTTVISLLERFYNPTKGQILINGENIDGIPLTEYRSSCGLVTQEPTLFEGTIRQNLVLGLHTEPSTSDIEQSCRDAEIWDFITSLPNGLDTSILGGSHSSFSGGQKQRLCIARALLRKPRLLLLDEATNSLDSVSEGLIQKAVDKIAEHKSVTVVAVAHRLATIKNADCIFVLGDGGKLQEKGTHKDLLGKRGVYWSMCEAQALDA